MLAASAYVLLCSTRNRIRVRLRRLRQPRYLAGAVAAAAYFYFTIFRGGRRGNRGRRGGGASPQADAILDTLVATGPALASLPLLLGAALAWALPFTSGLLEFSQAEVQFFFPAPVTHRQLIVHRLLRSQVGLLFGAIVAALMTPRGDVPTRLVRAVAIWVVLVSARLYFTGVVLARKQLRDRSLRARLLTRLPLAFVVITLAKVADGGWRAFTASPVTGPLDAVTRLADLAAAPSMALALLPFTALTRPLLASSWSDALVALPIGVVVMGATMAWVLALGEPFQDVAAEASERQAQSGAGRSSTSIVGKSTLATWMLAPTGRPETAFVWKAVQQTFRVIDRMAVLRLVVLAGTLVAVSVASRSNRGAASFGGLIATIVAGMAITLGPQMLRTDLRQDLAHLDLLKTWPVRGAAVVRGEMLWPTAQLTLVAWVAIAIASFLSGAAFPRVAALDRFSIAAAAACLAPSLIGTQFAVHNGTAILFPAWVPAGNQRVRGLDMMGQRLILLGGTMLAVTLLCLPGALVGGIIWFGFRQFVGALVFIPAAVVAALVVGLELLLVTEMLGPLYERVDIVEVERDE